MLKVLSPFDLSPIKEIPYHSKQDAEQALLVADNLFKDRSKWLSPHTRISILERTVQIMETKMEELTLTAAEEGGKPYVDSKVEVLRAINGVKLAIQHISQLKGDQVPMGLTEASVGRLAFTMREPIGVVASISAFNHPLNLIIHQTITAFAAGCPVIVKPASTTPLSCLKFVNILEEAGLPKGWCQVIICTKDVAEMIATDRRINYLSFIGSSKVGWYLKSKLHPGTRCALEHGGVAPVIVHKDANIDEMIPSLIKGGFYHAGQVCVSVQKIFVHASILDNITTQLKKMTATLIVGDPLDKNTDIGPLISPREVDRIESWVKEAINEGAELIFGGERMSETCYAPTILLNPSQSSKVSRLEIFGPVICIYSYSDIDNAIKIANSLDMHFQASVFTKNIDTALYCVQKLNASAVMVNDHTAFRVDWMPFGGRDASGIGVGGIAHSMNEMTREKLMVIKSKVL